MKTDEHIAEEYSNMELDIIDGEYSIKSIENAVIFGLETGRELSDEKAMRFAEFLSKCDTDHCYRSPKIYGIRSENTTFIYWHTAEELYASKAFEDYLSRLKK